MGREKIKYFSQNPENRDKMMGRNELLADFINSALKLREPPNEDDYPKGECPEVFIPAEELALTRKQISSHLQVLKTKFKADKWGQYMPTVQMFTAYSSSDRCLSRRKALQRSTTAGTLSIPW